MHVLRATELKHEIADRAGKIAESVSVRWHFLHQKRHAMNAQIKTGIPSTNDLLCISAQVMTTWETLAKVLGFNDAELDQLIADNADVFERCYQMLLRWTQKYGLQATYEALAKALQHPVMSQDHLAHQYCYKT